MAGLTTQRLLLHIPFPYIANTTIFLPVFGFLFCIIWSIVYDLESSTATHCRVPNYLPSISSATGGYAPQKYVWRICVALHCSPRLMFAMGYYRFHTEVHVGHRNYLYQTLASIASFLHVLEILALVGLTYISSTESPETHEHLFIAFMAFSLVYMLMTCVLFHWGRTTNMRVMTNMERKSFQYKVGLFIINITSFLMAVYLYFRHQTYCEPGMYTWFAFFEYLTVLSNIAYNGTVVWDFSDLNMSLDALNKMEAAHINNSKST